jgi:hypothetical protein
VVEFDEAEDGARARMRDLVERYTELIQGTESLGDDVIPLDEGRTTATAVPWSRNRHLHGLTAGLSKPPGDTAFGTRLT